MAGDGRRRKTNYEISRLASDDSLAPFSNLLALSVCTI